MSSFFYRNLKKKYPVVKSAKGVWITDVDGKRYLDGCSGAVVSNLGHGVEEINKAIEQQLGQIAFAHTSQFVSQAALSLAESLVKLAPEQMRRGGRVYFTSGGSESVETALKLARAYFVEQGEHQRQICISRWHGYHGSTLGALSVTGHPARRRPYQPLLRSPAHIQTSYRYRCHCKHTPGPCLADKCVLERANLLEEAILLYGPENVMAFIAEPIVGATLGAVVPGDQYWSRVREICNKYGILLIADEVMTGLGRTGSIFAMNHWGVSPDIITLGKGASAGYQPLGAVIASGKVVSAFESRSGIFEHGFTYSGHPVSCAAGAAVIKYLQDHKLPERVAAAESEFFEFGSRLYQFPFVGDVRGKGFMMGIEFVQDRTTKAPFPADVKLSQLITKECMSRGLLVYPGSAFIDGSVGDHIMITPPLNISSAELETLFDLLSSSLQSVQSSLQSIQSPLPTTSRRH